MRKLNQCLVIILGYLLIINNLNSESVATNGAEELKFHVIYNESLRSIMNKINTLIYESELDTLNKEELINNVNILISSSKNLTEALPGFELSVEERDVFQAMAIHLKKEANNIKIFTENNDKTNLQRSYKRLNDTCDACHELFRF